jgi:N utilization substance protein B
MPSRRQIREATIQFLYCSDLEGGANPAALRDPFWDFITESDRRSLQIATFKTIHHLAHGRDGRIAEFVSRHAAAATLLSAWPEAETLKLELQRIAELESSWSTTLAKIERLPRDDDSAAGITAFQHALDHLFKVDQDLAVSRVRFFQGIEDFPALRIPLEGITATLRRLQRISDRMRMIEHPESFPEQTDLAKIRDSKNDLCELRQHTDQLVDAVLANKETIDEKLASIIDHYAPERVDPVDRAILRLAAHEMLNSDLPHKVVINEAIEIAKRFGTTDSKRFVNGILDRISKDCDATNH